MSESRVAVRICMDVTDPGEIVWWAESDDVPGFYAAHDVLPSLLTLVESEMRDIALEEGREPPVVEFELRPLPTSNAGDREVRAREDSGSEAGRSIVMVEKPLIAA